MAQNTTITIPAETWTQLTDADVTTALNFQVRGNACWIKPTTDTTAPTDDLGAFEYQPGQGEAEKTIAELFPGVSGADRLWAYSEDGASVTVSHA